MRWIFLLLITFIMATSCSAEKQYRNSDLVVTYYGQEVHRASKYTSLDEFRYLINESEKKYIIFSADQCPSCQTLYEALKQSGHVEKVILLNLQERWVYELSQVLQIRGIPTLIVTDEKGNYVDQKVGPSDIIMYLIINVDTK